MAQNNPFADLISGQRQQPVGTILPEAPPPPPAPPARTAPGAATEGLKPGFMWVDPNNPAAGQVPIPTTASPTPVRPEITSASYADAVQGFTAARALTNVISDLKRLYREGPGSTSGVRGLQDYLPTEANERFNTAANAARGTVGQVLGFTGGQLNSIAEAQMNIGAYIPTASQKDKTILDTIKRLEDLQQQGLQRSIAVLGGVPDNSGQIIPVPQGTKVTPESVESLLSGREPEGPNAMDMIRLSQGGGSGKAVPLADANSLQRSMRYNPEIDSAHAELIDRLISENGGRLPPQQYAQEVGAMLSRFNEPYGQGEAEKWARWAGSVNSYLDAGGRTIPTRFGLIEVMSMGDIAANNLVNNPVGGALAGAANTLSLGTVENIAPAQYAALRDTQGVPVLAGEIAGAIGGTSAISGLGRQVAARVAPSLLGGGARGQFMRNVAADVAYGAGYGGVSQGDPVSGAALGAGGSFVGQGVGRGLGAAIGGMQRTAAAQALRDRGVPVSVARQLGMGRAEDLAQSIPFVGDVSRARQLESFEGFNRAAMQEAGAPIGFQPSQIGVAGVEDLGNAVSRAYEDATRGVTAQVDTQTFRDLRPVMRAIRGLPDDYRAAAESILERRVNPLLQSGRITGDQYQQAIRGIKQARANAAKNPSLAGFEQEFRDALTNVEDMLTGTMTRGAGPDVAANLAAANAANRGFKTIEDAALNRAKVGTQTGEVNVFTPAQLLQAGRAAENRGFGANPLMQLGREGQEVLPSTVPNSGTADRALFATALGGAGLLGGGGGYAGEQTPQGALEGAGAGIGTVAGATALATLLGTRGGQAALERLLISRPQIMQTVGQGFRRRAGLFGSAGNVTAQNYGY